MRLRGRVAITNTLRNRLPLLFASFLKLLLYSHRIRAAIGARDSFKKVSISCLALSVFYVTGENMFEMCLQMMMMAIMMTIHSVVQTDRLRKDKDTKREQKHGLSQTSSYFFLDYITRNK